MVCNSIFFEIVEGGRSSWRVPEIFFRKLHLIVNVFICRLFYNYFKYSYLIFHGFYEYLSLPFLFNNRYAFFIIMRLIIKNPHLIKNNHFYWYCNSFQNKMTPTNSVRVILVRYHSCRNLPRNNGILTNYKLLNLGFINNEYLRYPPRAVPHVHTNVHLTPKFWKNIVQTYT